MSRTRPANDALAQALAPYAAGVPALGEGVRSALALPEGWGICEEATVAEYPVAGFVLRPGEEVFAVYLCTPGRFLLFELAAGGDSLSVALPLARIRRVVESRLGEVVSLTVEIEADRLSLSSSAERLEGPATDAAGAAVEGQRYARSESRGSVLPTVYEMASPAGSPEAAALAGFARSLRNLIGL